MSGKNVLVLKNFSPPKQAGDYSRLICLTGKKKGEVYYLTGERIVVGRGEEVDIQVFDMKSSREHAEIKKVGNNFIITDLGSQNGVVVNDLRVTQYNLREGDRIVIGQTVYKFGSIKVEDKSSFEDIKEKISTVRNENKILNEDKSEDDVPAPKSKKKRGLLLIGLVVLGAMFLMDEKPQENKNLGKKGESPQDVTDEFTSFNRKKKSNEDKELEEKLKSIFQRGLREAREGNYFRAINEFNLALILSPQNARASYYLNRTMQLLDEDIEQNFIQARRAFDALKFETAINSYCSIIRLLQNFPEDERYKTAEDNIKEIEKRLGMDEGEIKCL